VLDNQLNSLSRRYQHKEIARLSIAPRRIELFLERFANLDIGNERRRNRFTETFADLLPASGPTNLYQLEVLQVFQSNLQSHWRETSPLYREAGLMMLAGFQLLGAGEHLDGYSMVLMYAVKHAHLLRFCANPACREPYFVARRGSQIYCSPECAKPAQKEAKIKWWNEHGAKRREKSRGKRRKHGKAT